MALPLSGVWPCAHSVKFFDMTHSAQAVHNDQRKVTKGVA